VSTPTDDGGRALVEADPRFHALLSLSGLADGEPRGDGLTDVLADAADVVAEVLENVHGPAAALVLEWAGFPPRLP